jgi:sterol desaturase/sphingolipid hydroxylase (fatty acid hydroxylase superfamily)
MATSKVGLVTDGPVPPAQGPDLHDLRGAEYPVRGKAHRGGAYNSHLASAAVFVALTAAGLMALSLTVWIGLCLVAALFLDARPWSAKVAPRAMVGQFKLYLQVLLGAARDAFPYYLFAYLVYVCVAPLWLPYNLAISSFVMLYAFNMLIRGYWVIRYLALLWFRWDKAGRTFEVRQANLRSRSFAIRHVLWSYFLGNVGLVIRCSSQVLTIALFEYVRTTLGMDLTKHTGFRPHLLSICIAATIVWLAAMWPAVRRALLVYYRTHRTFHHCGPLYDSVHGIHHRAVLPTPLDAGTISPAELIITEMAFPVGTLVPNWWWTIAQMILGFVGHWPSHDTGTQHKFSQHHLHHHRYFTVNFGLSPAEDARFGTLHDGDGARGNL